MEEETKSVKHFQCKLCKRKYVKWNAWMNKHIVKTGHNKFKKINEENFLANVLNEKPHPF